MELPEVVGMHVEVHIWDSPSLIAWWYAAGSRTQCPLLAAEEGRIEIPLEHFREVGLVVGGLTSGAS